MTIKVCGLKDPANIEQLANLPIDIFGFVFYDKSPRFAGYMAQIPASAVHRAGVFVNAPFNYVMDKVKTYGLDYVQLHGEESPAECLRYKQEGLKVIKAFGIRNAADFDACPQYENCCDLFLFDTKTENRGGSGRSFDHSLLQSYSGKVPFLLSGGISLQQTEYLKNLRHPLLAGFDLNSRFESAPGIKDTASIAQFINEMSIKNQIKTKP